MAIIDFPNDPPIADIEWTPPANTQVNESEWTGRQRLTVLPYAGRWKARVSFPAMTSERELLPWRAFLSLCRGRTNSFRIVACENVQIPLAMTIRVDGAAQSGSSIDVDGFPDVGVWLKAGHMVTIGEQLIILDAPVEADATGKATMTLGSELRAVPADNDVIEVHWPWALMRMAADDNPWSANRGRIYGVTAFSVEEAF